MLRGGPDADTLRGGLGDDTYELENGSDLVQDIGGIDTATSSITRSLAGGGLVNVERLVLVNLATALNGAGNGLANVLNGNNFNNTLDGGANNDTLLGNGGNDTLFGRAGNDVLLGGLGNDLLVGGFGRDVQTGGAGNDIFRFSAIAESLVANPDIITDFDDASNDRIDVSTLFGPALAYRHNLRLHRGRSAAHQRHSGSGCHRTGEHWRQPRRRLRREADQHHARQHVGRRLLPMRRGPGGHAANAGAL